MEYKKLRLGKQSTVWNRNAFYTLMTMIIAIFIGILQYILLNMLICILMEFGFDPRPIYKLYLLVGLCVFVCVCDRVDLTKHIFSTCM